MANLTITNPIDQIKNQKLEAFIETDEKRYFETDYTLCEDEEISIDVNLEIYLEYHPDYGTSVLKVKAHFMAAYDNRECEDLELNLLEKREIENYISENLIINLN